ncbi:hypothetical protein IU448_18660 [Nocardia flavorosea]|uniref:hypothetical protein n=1 Tax=Nocardia flavorosea TaxID=53429 RepID=UPI00189460B5|nr:hypothetical protein [Nocardia flavorosea]MBF6351022.1 hypothetical protein [Nocardia flavorosea]
MFASLTEFIVDDNHEGLGHADIKQTATPPATGGVAVDRAADKQIRHSVRDDAALRDHGRAKGGHGPGAMPWDLIADAKPSRLL